MTSCPPGTRERAQAAGAGRGCAIFIPARVGSSPSIARGAGSTTRTFPNKSRRGLDWTNFFMADVQIGFRSFLAFYLADLGWSKQNVGFALIVGGLAGVLSLIPGGALTDALRW